jgi:RNA polymerase sigma-32 factor
MNTFSHTHDDHLARFVATAQKFPLVTAEQERELINRWRDKGDTAALTLLLGSHLRLVIKMAYGNRGYGLSIDDLIAEGNTGLMKAVERFDPDRGFRFSTYAQWWVRAAIQEYVLRNWSLVRLGTTAAQKKLFFNLRRLKGSLDAYEEGDLSSEVAATIAAELDVPKDAVVEMNRRLTGGDSSLNMPAGEEGDTSHQDFLQDEAPDQEMAFGEAEEFSKRWDVVEKALEELTPRERHILTERRLNENQKTLGELSAVYGVSRERIRQIEVRAMGKLQQAVCTTAEAQGLLGDAWEETLALKAAA